MAESEAIQTEVTEMAIQAATAAVMLVREANQDIRHQYSKCKRGLQLWAW